jgi:hypothetical protein
MKASEVSMKNIGSPIKLDESINSDWSSPCQDRVKFLKQEINRFLEDKKLLHFLESSNGEGAQLLRAEILSRTG